MKDSTQVLSSTIYALLTQLIVLANGVKEVHYDFFISKVINLILILVCIIIVEGNKLNWIENYLERVFKHDLCEF